MFVLIFILAHIRLDTELQIPLGEFEIFSQESFAVSDEGVIAYLDDEGSQLVLFRPDGTLIARSGGKGQGPQEFQDASEVCWSPREGVFVVLDASMQRVSRWKPDGSFVRVANIPVQPSDFRQPREKTSLFLLNPLGLPGIEPTLASYDSETEEQNALWVYPREDTKAFAQVGEAVFPMKWDGKLQYGVGRDFIAIASPEDGVLHVLDLEGRPSRSPLLMKIPARPITPDDVKQVVADLGPFRKILESQGFKASELDPPEHWPLVTEIHVDSSDRIWVFSHPTGQRGAHPFQVYSREGKLVGKGALASIPRHIGKDALYYTEEREEDEVVLVRARIEELNLSE